MFNDAPNRPPEAPRPVKVDARILDTRMGYYLVTMVVAAGGSVVPMGSGGRTDGALLARVNADFPPEAFGGCQRLSAFEVSLDTWPMDEPEQAAYVKDLCRRMQQYQ